jgi:transposase
MKLSVFSQRCQELEDLFERAGDPRRVTIVAIDTAKRTHVARICNGTGAYRHKKAFSVANTAAGIEYLKVRIDKDLKQCKLPMSTVVVAMEDPPHYAINFAQRTAGLGCLVVRVNALKASRKRKTDRSSSDVSALDGICRMVMDRQAYTLGPECGPFAELRLAARERGRLVQMETRLKNIIHRYVEVLFPGFADVSGLHLFGPPALALMKDNFCASKFRRTNTGRLAERLRKRGSAKADDTAEAIIQAARNATCGALQREHAAVLRQHVKTLEGIQASLALQTMAMGKALAKTDGVVMTSIPGIGVVLAGHLVAEMGMAGLYGPPDRTASYAGIIRKEVQTGGPQSPVVRLRLPKNRNAKLKNYLRQAASHVGTTPLPLDPALGWNLRHDLMDYYHGVEQRGGKSKLMTAKKLLRAMGAMVKNRALYLPPDWLGAHHHFPELAPLYLNATIRAVAGKWQKVGINMENNDDLARFLKPFCDLREDYRAGRAKTLEG